MQVKCKNKAPLIPTVSTTEFLFGITNYTSEEEIVKKELLSAMKSVNALELLSQRLIMFKIITKDQNKTVSKPNPPPRLNVANIKKACKEYLEYVNDKGFTGTYNAEISLSHSHILNIKEIDMQKIELKDFIRNFLLNLNEFFGHHGLSQFQLEDFNPIVDDQVHSWISKINTAISFLCSYNSLKNDFKSVCSIISHFMKNYRISKNQYNCGIYFILKDVKYSAVLKNKKETYINAQEYGKIPLDEYSYEFVEYSNGKFACTPKSSESKIVEEISTVAYDQDDDFEKKITVLMDTNII